MPRLLQRHVTRALIDAILGLTLDPEKVVVVAGIGCSGRISAYLDYSTVHAAHGRALAVATGVKAADPSLHVIVAMGDGDCSAIGGNHFIHAARRNIDLTALVFNNSIYGMTGGQMSPTTHLGDKSTTSVYGNVEPAFDLCELAHAAGATYVARGTAWAYRSSPMSSPAASPTRASPSSRPWRCAPLLRALQPHRRPRRVPAAPEGARRAGQQVRGGRVAAQREHYPVGVLHHSRARGVRRRARGGPATGQGGGHG